MSAIQIHELVPLTYVNGPGPRACIWVQGCSLACAGCFNPQTHEFDQGKTVEVSELVDSILGLEQIQGVTISGGEPLQQFDSVLELINLIRKLSSLSIVIFSGFCREEIEQMPRASLLMKNVDVIVAGRYEQNKHLARGLLGSSNQELIFCSDRYSNLDFQSLGDLEFVINKDGSITITGVDIPGFPKG